MERLIATTKTRTTATSQQEEQPSVSFYSSRRLKLYTSAEIGSLSYLPLDVWEQPERVGSNPNSPILSV
jgi:hypothetical protein